MRILVSGGSGFIGAPLIFFLTSQGHTVVRLVRESEPHVSDSIRWDPDHGKARKEDFESFNAVIHLSGEPLTLARWSTQKKEKILLSRTVSTQFLSHLLSLARHPPETFICASAFGYYGNRGEEILTEESEPGSSFLANVCCEWEKATQAIANRVRTAQIRLGIVLGPHGGVLPKMLLPYRLGLGGRQGSGKQWVSWITLVDVIQAIHHILLTPSLEGPINLVSPHPIRQNDFSKTLAHLLHRPRLLPLPAWFLHLLYGSTADELLLFSARAEPTQLLASKFVFHYSDLRSALCNALQTI